MTTSMCDLPLYPLIPPDSESDLEEEEDSTSVESDLLPSPGIEHSSTFSSFSILIANVMKEIWEREGRRLLRPTRSRKREWEDPPEEECKRVRVQQHQPSRKRALSPPLSSHPYPPPSFPTLSPTPSPPPDLLQHQQRLHALSAQLSLLSVQEESPSSMVDEVPPLRAFFIYPIHSFTSTLYLSFWRERRNIYHLLLHSFLTPHDQHSLMLICKFISRERLQTRMKPLLSIPCSTTKKIRLVLE